MHNITQAQLDKLDDYLDNRLDAAEIHEVSEMLSSQPEMRLALEELKLARTVIGMHGLQQSVRDHHQENMKLARQNDPVAAMKVSWKRNYVSVALRVAAALLVLVVAGSVVQTLLLGNAGIYQDNYLSYNLPVTRNEEAISQRSMDSLFRAGQFEKVINAFAAGDSSDNFSRFLTAVSYLETGQEEKAIGLLNGLRKYNEEAPVKSFEQESAYYLALAYIKAGEEKKALAVINEMKADQQHTYRQNFSAWDEWKLYLLSMRD